MVEKSKLKSNLTFKVEQEANKVDEKHPHNEPTLNASDRINLQHIMELRELFEKADLDKGGALEIEEVSYI